MNKIYTCRVTNIEAFRQFITAGDEDEKPWINEPSLINTLKGIESFNVKADYGTAGHSIIENAAKYRTNTGYQVKDFTFTEAQAKPMINHAQEHAMWTREVPLSKLYHLPKFDIILTGTTDAIEGCQLRDTKFKFGSFDVQDFVDSIQWRLYLDMVGLDIFWYDFFRVKGFKTMADCGKAVIDDVESMMVKRYEGMDGDIMEVLNEFADYITFKGFTDLIEITPAKYKRIIYGDSRLKSLNLLGL